MLHSYFKTRRMSNPFRTSFLIAGLCLLATTAAHSQQEIIQTGDYKIAPAPEMGEVCKLPPTDINRNYFKKHDFGLGRTVKKDRESEFQISYVNGCDNTANTWPEDAKIALEYAMTIWESYLKSDIPIKIQANWEELTCNPDEGCTLGSAGPTRIVQLSGAEPDTWYSIAQGSAMSGQDIVSQIDDEEYDIVITMNCNFEDWYFGTDADTPTGLIDFVTVALHEIGHGIGFIGSMRVDEEDQTGDYGFGGNNDPVIYDRFTEDGDGVALLNESAYPNPSAELYNALTGQIGGVHFDGESAREVFDGVPIPLYAPEEWDGGSSYSHVDQTTFSQQQNLANALMRPKVDRNFALHSPGPVFCGMLSDWGWPISLNCTDIVENNSQFAIQSETLEQTNNGYRHDFGVHDVGDILEFSFNVTNETSGSDSLFYVLSMAGDVSMYRKGAETSYTNKLGPGDTETVTIIYEPADDGIHEAEANFYHNSAGVSNPIVVSLRGEAYYDNFITVTVEELDFNVTNVNKPVERTFEINNSEHAESSLSYDIDITNENFQIDPGLSSGILLAGESAEIVITYDPLADDRHSGGVIVNHNAGNLPNPYEIAVTGEALKQNEIARLEDNFPNPFNPTTTIPYILPEASDVRLDIYNVNGQHIQTLVNSQQPEGRYELSFEAGGLASGIYFYRLIVNDFIDTKRLLLIK